MKLKKMAKIVESLKLDRLYPNYSSRPKSVGKISVYTVFWASFDPLPLVHILFTQPLWRYEGLQLSICTNHTAGNTLNLQQERDIQIFSTQSGSQATCKLLDTCKHYLYKPDTCKPLTTTTLGPYNRFLQECRHHPHERQPFSALSSGKLAVKVPSCGVTCHCSDGHQGNSVRQWCC